ncbi:ABC-2 type transport system permease protein [Sphingomonas gellani]|uniref:ABC-2 type transport system permease protein n=1 Tax=Sphingomonas gellani TaxID=1166340 RepID=A0A1H8AUT9_9SPHN|nr:ABC transporter permease [Sphingomonas gellani]SEM74581.1 ABC-2 type transport system permease protein [Sphingomonas gellani]
MRDAFERTLLEILSVRELLSLAVVSVLFYAFYYPAPYSQQQVVALPLVVVDGDNSVLSRGVVRGLSGTQAVRIVARAHDLPEARELLRERRAEGIVLISRGLSAAVLSGRPGAGVAVILNGSYFVRAEGIARALGEVVAAEAEQVGRALGLAPDRVVLPIRTEALFNPTGGYRDYVFPAIANIILQQTLLFTAARLIAERRRRGAWRRGMREAIGTWLACVVLGVAGQAFFFGFAYWVQDVPRGGNISGLLLAMPLFSAAVAALGLSIGSWFRDGDDALKLLMPTSVPLVFLAGFAWPLDQMPGWVSAIAWLSPATAAMHLLVRFNQMGATVDEAAGPLIVMMALVFAYGATWLWRCEVGMGLNRQRSA